MPFIVALEGLGSSGKTTVLDYLFKIKGCKDKGISRKKFPENYDKYNILSAYDYLLEMKSYIDKCKSDIIFVDRYKYSTLAYANARNEELDDSFFDLYNSIPDANVVIFLDTTPNSSAKRDFFNKGVTLDVRNSVYASFHDYFWGKKHVLRYKVNPVSFFSKFKYKRIARDVYNFVIEAAMNYEERRNNEDN